jgi:hypothetical protein
MSVASTTRTILGRRLGVLIAGAVVLTAVSVATAGAAAPAPMGDQAAGLARQGAGPGSGGRASTPTPGVLMERGRHRPATIAMLSARLGLGPMGSNDPELGPRRTARPPADASGGFIYRKGRYTPLDTIPGAAALGAIPGFPDATFFETHFAINDRGETAGFYGDAVPGPDGLLPGSTHGFVKSRRGEVTSFDVPGARDLLVKGNNDHGQVVGEYFDTGATPGPDGMLPPGSIHGFIRQRSGRITSFDVPFFRLHDIADINDRGQIVGYYDNPTGGGGAFLRQPTGAITRIEVPGAPVTNAHAINHRGQVVGAYLEPGAVPNPDGAAPPGTVHGYLWDQGRMTRLDVPGSIWTQPFGINDRGQISGGYYDAEGKQHGFLFERGSYKTLDAPGRTDNIAWGINNRGEIVIPEGTVRLLPVATQ